MNETMEESPNVISSRLQSLELNVARLLESGEANITNFNMILGRMEKLETNVTKVLQSSQEYEIDNHTGLEGVGKLEVSGTRSMDANGIPRDKLKKYEISKNKNELANDFSNGKLTSVDDEDDNKLKNTKVDRKCLNLIKNRQQQEDNSSTIFMSKRKRKWVYYILCAAIYINCIIASVYYIEAAYSKWQTSPVVTSTSNKQLRFQDIPFPAVTICWPDRMRSDYNHTENLEDCVECSENNECRPKIDSCGRDELTTLLFAHEVCWDLNLTVLTGLIWEDTRVPFIIDEDELKTYMEKLLPPCEENTIGWIATHFKFTENTSRCDDIFQQFLSVSPDRVCMTYNSLRHSDIYEDKVVTSLPLSNQSKRDVSRNPIWTFDNMFTDFEGSQESVPYYGVYNFQMGFRHQEYKYEEMCQYSKGSFASVMVHSPNDIPFDPEENLKLFLHENISLTMDLYPKITLASDDLLRYTPQQRGCYFANENKLAMFRFYSKTNCELECLVNSYVDAYNCVPYYYLRPNSSVKVCTYDQSQPPYFCGCLPSCNSISYEIKTREVTKSWEFRKSEVAVGYVWNSLFYIDIRYSINSRAEFLAFSLGILGGFLGVSVTCVWHLVYSRTEKLISSARRWEKKKLSPD